MMTYDELIARFGSQQKLAAEIGVTQAAISYWKIRGVPKLRWLQIEKILEQRKGKQ
jgi:predicted transcriptional regulator